jgi:hypothetical protein
MDQNAQPTVTAAKRHTGGCHCGAVRFEVDIDASCGSRCNCSICTKVGALGRIVKPEALAVVSGAESLSSYEWGGKVGHRFFCKHCGVHCFGQGHLAMVGGDFVSVNLNSLDDVDPRDVKVVYWDGRHDNWQAGARETPWPIASQAEPLAHLTA